MVTLSFKSAALATLILIGAVWAKRVFWMVGLGKTNPPLTAPQSAFACPKISVVIPARNEERNIARCLYHLFRQNYPLYELLIVDDRSSDRTGHLIENFVKLSPVPCKVIRIEKLPSGWTGKNYAMFTGSKAATGQWLLFTDADTTHSPDSMRAAVAAALDRDIDFLTLAPETECRSFWEKVVQPLAVGSLALWFDETKLANGQFILVKKQVYEKLGGNESVRDQVVEDVELAKKARNHGYRVNFLNGTGLYSTRMYSSLREIQTGWTRILTYLFEKNICAISHKIFLFLCFSILPFALLGTEVLLRIGRSTHYDAGILIASAAVSAWIVVIRFYGNKMLRSDPWYAFLHPLGSLVMVWILLCCGGRVLFKKPSVWRGDYHA